VVRLIEQPLPTIDNLRPRSLIAIRVWARDFHYLSFFQVRKGLIGQEFFSAIEAKFLPFFVF
jgi:hypothetical protein